MAQTEIKIIDRYVSLFSRELRKQGYRVGYDEIASELAEAYCECLKTYNHNDDRGASLNTYVVSAFKNRVKNLRARLKRERAIFNMEHGGDSSDIGGDVTPLDQVMAESIKHKIFAAITDARSLLIFNEMVNTSDKVLGTMEALRSHYSDTPSRERGARGGGLFTKSVALVYGYSHGNVRWHVQKVQGIARKVLTDYFEYDK